MRAISYRGEVVAIATGDRVYLAPQLSALPPADPKLRFVAAMCLYSLDVDQGKVPGPYRDEDAELYGRCLLLPDEGFMAHAAERDADLARRFGVPVEQAAEKRRDIDLTSRRCDAVRCHRKGGPKPHARDL